MPRSPTSTTRAIPNRPRIFVICAGKVLGSPMLPAKTSTATGQSLPVGQEPEDDLQFVPLAVAGMAELRQGALPALEVRRGDVVEDEAAVRQMPVGQGRLDTPLLREQPVHGRIEVVFIGMVERQPLAQGAGERVRGQPP